MTSGARWPTTSGAAPRRSPTSSTAAHGLRDKWKQRPGNSATASELVSRSPSSPVWWTDMTDLDPTLEIWERGERRRTLWIAFLVLVLLALLFVVTALAVILVRRSPVIARIDRAEESTKCVQVIEASFLAS